MTIRSAVLCAVAIVLASPAAAQVPAEATWSDEIPAHLSVVQGTATLERDGVVEAAETNLILLAGDRLRTDRGRVEILFADGSSVAIDEFSSVDLLDASLMRMLEGRVRVAIARATGNVEYRVDTVAGSALLLTPGEYRLSLSGANPQAAELDLSVLRGSAELTNEFGRTAVRAGTHAVTRATTAPSLPYTMNSAAWDAFDVWADEQREARLGYESARYLPADLRYDAGTFDRDGSWAYQSDYGYVWYPAVPVGWRPYSQGRWSFAAHFGWTWIGVDRWSWTTHHYGRWGVTANRWYWIPGRQWGPAWVSWASAPGYLGWCPLGYDGRPVFGVSTIISRYSDPWFGWTVLPSNNFRHNVSVARYAVPRRGRAPGTWSQFALSSDVPRPTVATAQSAPLRSPSARYAVSRNGSGAAGIATPRGGTSAVASAAGRQTPAGRATSGIDAAAQRRTATTRAVRPTVDAAASSRSAAPATRPATPSRIATSRGLAVAEGSAAGRSAASRSTATGTTTGRTTTARGVSAGDSTRRAAVPSTRAPATPSRSTLPSARPPTSDRRSAPPAGASGSTSTRPGTATSRSVGRGGSPAAAGSSAGAPSRSAPPTGTSRPPSRTVSPGVRRGAAVQPPASSSSGRGGSAASRSSGSTSRVAPPSRSGPPAGTPPPRTSGGGRSAPPPTSSGSGRTATRRVGRGSGS